MGSVVGSGAHTEGTMGRVLPGPGCHRMPGRPDPRIGALVAEICDRMSADSQLGPLLGLAPPDDHPPDSRGTGALAIELTQLITQALARKGRRAASGVPRYMRHYLTEPDDFDRFGHHVLTGALVHRVGPDGLLFIGAVLADIQQTITPARQRSGKAPPASADLRADGC
jgi:hypothetical protein